MEGRDRPSGSTGIKFPKRKTNPQTGAENGGVRRSQPDIGSAGSSGATRFVFVPVERTRYVPIPVEVSSSYGAPLQTPLGKVSPTWIPDAKAVCCMGCEASFGITRWRHHCRACGKVFCSSCTSLKAKLEYLKFSEARVCTVCFGELAKHESESMGAGVVKPQPGGGGFQIHINTGQMPRTQSHSTSSVKCEECAVTFSAFKKKKPCRDCGRDFCSACTIQVGGSSPRQQQCLKCQTVLSGNFTRSQLSNWKVKDLKALLITQNVNTKNCKEKNDLIDLVISYYGGHSNLSRPGTEHERMVEQLAERMRQENEQYTQTGTQQNQSAPVNPTPNQQQGTNTSTNQMPQSSQTQSNQAQLDAQRLRDRQEREMREADIRRQHLEEEERQETQPVNPNLKLDDVKSEEEIEALSIKSLKRLLLNNFVDYKGCCERWELQERVKRLWRDNEANKKKAEGQRKVSEDPSVPMSSEDELCKICMDAAIDCVLLECGHMVTCTNCGKRLAECPICRQYVVRAVHTFKS